MPTAKAFIDSNVVLYLLSGDTAKANRAEHLLTTGVIVSVQVLNEVANVARRKAGLSWDELDTLLEPLRVRCSPQPLTLKTHRNGLLLAQRYGFSLYDSMIVAAALLAGCEVLWSEDMQDGLLVDGQLRIVNPFNNRLGQTPS